MIKTNVDWGEASVFFDRIKEFSRHHDLLLANEAQTRFDVIDRIIREVFSWQHGQIQVEEPEEGPRRGFVDYILRSGDVQVVIEAKKAGSAFPSPTKRRKLKLSGTVLGEGEIGSAIKQCLDYCEYKKAEIGAVTNGYCWCLFPANLRVEETYGTVFFPFDNHGDGEELFRFLGVSQIESGALQSLSLVPAILFQRLSDEIRGADGRIDRNNVADHIGPALDGALYADSLIANVENLEKCYVSTSSRIKYDSALGLHLRDHKPELVEPARRVHTGKEERNEFSNIVSTSGYAPQVTVLIGPVGSGKSTFLKHFELVSGKSLLKEKRVHWVYIDFEQMGKGGDPRTFLYRALRNYLLSDHPENPTDYKTVVNPAYEEEVAGLSRGPYAILAHDKQAFNIKIQEIIQHDFDEVEPYVDKIFSFLGTTGNCFVVFDNLDLYEDDDLETKVFSEGLAFSKRVKVNVAITVRDSTFIKHRNDSIFDAYEFRRFWLDPPPFREVLSKRLSCSKLILQGKRAELLLFNGIKFVVPDLSVYFDIVQRSFLGGYAGDFIECMSDLNIRRGISFVKSFLTSGHIQADRALKCFVDGDPTFIFPFHEIFKGCILGQWKHLSDLKTDGINLFDSGLIGKNLKLLRLFVLRYLYEKGRIEDTVEVSFADLFEKFSILGCDSESLLRLLLQLQKSALVRSVDGADVSPSSKISISRSGGYYITVLVKTMVYVEECIYDCRFEQGDLWESLYALTNEVESCPNMLARMEVRKKRLGIFLAYLKSIEESCSQLYPDGDSVFCMSWIAEKVGEEMITALEKCRRRIAGRS